MKIRYALDQTKTKNEIYKFLTDKANEFGCFVYGYYKGNGKTKGEIIYVDGLRIEYKKMFTKNLKESLVSDAI